MLYQIMYSSRAARTLASDDLELILDDARVGNERNAVTGALIFADGIFVQILEGERETLDRLLASISRDMRHRSMKVFYQCAITQRAFHDWRMAYLPVNVSEMARWTGLPNTQSIDELLQQVHADQELVPRILVHIVEAIAARSNLD